ncbi:ATP-binding protein [Sorangium sp. So ce260]|uniref:ATP-binding protein n=1 Tax=Sorangium sp. So ce260 TaxID=3133291 RepID=UPI003F606F92
MDDPALPHEPASGLAQLVRELERLRGLLSARIAAAEGASSGEGAPPPPSDWDPDAAPQTPLDHLCAAFGLGAFERDVLLLCAGCELDASFAALCRRASVDPSRLRPVVGLLLACLPGASWTALGPHGPLRRWQLVRVHGERAISDAEVTIDEPVLHYLLEGVLWDPALGGLVETIEPQPISTASQGALVDRVIGVWDSARRGQLPIVQIVGPDPGAGIELLAAMGSRLDALVMRIDAALLPASATELQSKLLAWQRLSRIEGAIGVVDAASQSPDRALAGDALASWLEVSKGPTVLLTRTRRVPGARTWVTLELDPPQPSEQSTLWRSEIESSFANLDAAAIDPVIERLVGTFNLSAGRIRSACADARGMLAARREPRVEGGQRSWSDALWHACRIQARPDLDAFAQRLTGGSTFADLCVDPRTATLLGRICDQVRLRGVVHGRWGIGGKSRRGLGIAALFSGASGTGKTMAAEVIGNELCLDVYRVDLSAVVSKYIGETEKNLARVFDAAEGSGVILLFDEADALFGKRTEVKDSHDRHANVEIGYLLQRLEAYHGLAILTTNLREDLDQAFLRRLRFIVEFPHPNANERQLLWKRALRGAVPVAAIDHDALAGLPLTGGQIRNIVINAAFAAATADAPIDTERLRDAILHELEKNGQRLSNAELARLERPGGRSTGGLA